MEIVHKRSCRNRVPDLTAYRIAPKQAYDQVRRGLQVEQELAEERAAAEIEAHRAQEAIQAKQQELQRIEQQRQYEVCPLLSRLLHLVHDFILSNNLDGLGLFVSWRELCLSQGCPYLIECSPMQTMNPQVCFYCTNRTATLERWVQFPFNSRFSVLYLSIFVVIST